MAKNNHPDPQFWGSATVGERGQIVIPADARQEMDIKQGDKLLIFSGMRGGALNVIKAEQVSEFVSRAMARLTKMEEIARKEEK